MRTKVDAFNRALSASDYDIIMLTETWLHKQIVDSELSSNYNIYRCDRNPATSSAQRGGGVLIALKKELITVPIPLSNCDQLEQATVKVKIGSCYLFLCCIYLRPNSSLQNYELHFSAAKQILDQASAQDTVIVVGDYNLPHLQWTLDHDLNSYLPTNASTEAEIALTETLLSAGLHQICSTPNDNLRYLDLAFSNDAENVVMFESATSILPTDRHHKTHILCLELNPVLEQSEEQLEFDFDFRQCDYGLLADAFASVDWSILEDASDINVAVNSFYDRLNEVLEQNVPRKRPPRTLTPKYEWWNADLRRLRNQLRKARKRFNKCRSSEHKNHLRIMERDFKCMNELLYRQHIENLQQNMKNDPSSFWNYFKMKKRSSSIPVDVSLNGVTSSNVKESTDLFSNFFQSVYNPEDFEVDDDYISTLPSYELHLPLPRFSHDEVYVALKSIDPKKGAGPDLIPPVLFRQCAASLTGPISLLFNRSLSERSFPTAWKTAAITPVFKSGNIHHVENYRPISILCSLSKILEILVHERLLAAAKPLISECQHGFVKKRSTVTNLMCYVSSLNNSLEKKVQVDSVYIDFAKAFDCVPHSVLTAKLDRLGFPSWLIEWLRSYLTNRQAFTRINKAHSRQFATPSGVPQGSHLGPLLFIIFVNDLCNLLLSDKLLYADDLKIFRKILSVADCLALQADIETLENWCHLNGMLANVKKCKVVNFARTRNVVSFGYKLNGVVLETVKSILDLGVKVDNRLTFSEHIAVTTAKGFATLGFLRRSTNDFDDVYALKAVYCSAVRSILEYAVQVWAPIHASQCHRLERVQRSFVRYALRRLHWNDPLRLPQYSHRCALIDLPTLEKRREELQQLLVFDILTNRIDSTFLLERVNIQATSRALRRRQFLWLPFHRTTYGKNNPIDRCCEMFNKVYHVFDFNMCKNKFKLALRRLL